MKSLYRTASLPGNWLFIALMAFTMQVHAATNQDSAALVTLKVSNAPIEDVFLRIEAQTGFSFTYSTQLIDKKEKVSVDFKREQLGDVLRELLGKRNLRWVIRGAGIVILQDSKPASQIERFSATDSIPSTTTIKGSVTGEEGYALPGATIIVKGTDRGTTTDKYGRFLLIGAPSMASIGVSYTGYEPQVFNTRGSETLVVKLKKSIGALDEQVVIAYGTSSRRKLTGTVGRVRSTEIEKQPVANPLQALQGRIPGVVINQQSGMPGSNFVVQIRGQNSLRNSATDNGNNPFYVVDGVPYSATPFNVYGVVGPYPLNSSIPVYGSSPLNNINPADIESIEVLKDADATAIYGSRGANGVILITTKKGAAGRLSVEGSVYHGFSKVSRRMKLLNTKQYIEMRLESIKNDGRLNDLSQNPHQYPDITMWDTIRNTDWQKELIGGTARSTNAELNFFGGTAYAQYRFGVGYNKESTVYPGDFSNNRFTTHFSLTTQSQNKKFRSQISLNYSTGNTNLLSTDLTSAALTLAPNAPRLFSDNGQLNWENGTFDNPLQFTKRPYDSKVYTFLNNVTVSYEVIKGLHVKSSFGITNARMKEVKKIPISSFSPQAAQTAQNTTTFGSSDNYSWIVEPQLTYSKYFDRHKLTILVGSTIQYQNAESLLQSAKGFVSEDLMENIGAVPSSNVTNATTYSEYKYSGIFGRINYDFSDKYLISLTGRRDGSSRFGPGNRFGNFGSIGAAWVFTEENFLKNSDLFVSFGKIRASYGTTGSDQIPPYGYLDTYTTISGQYQNVSGLFPSRLLNPDFGWEINRKFESSIEMSFFKNIVFASATYYNNRSSNQLVGYPLPPTTGFANIQYNLDATVQNSGLEIELSSTPVKTASVNWFIGLNATFPRNRLISYPNLGGSSYSSTYVVGEPLSIQKGYRFYGVNPESGLYEVVDIDKNGSINTLDRQEVTFVGQKWYGGVNNSFSIKRFQLDLLIQYVAQNSYNYLSTFGAPGRFTNQPVEILERWKKPGDAAEFQKFTNSSTAFNLKRASNAIISSSDYLRLKNVSLTYAIPTTLYSKLKLKAAEVYLRGQNLITLTEYRGLDPENQGFGLPPLKTIVAGCKITL